MKKVETRNKRGIRKILAFMGPAYLVSVGYMDPGNWATDIAGGSQFGYSLMWILLMSNLSALLLQYLSARLGVVYKLDLAQATKKMYGKQSNYMLYFFAQIGIIATDLAEVLGMAIGLQLLFGLPLLYGVFLTLLDTFLIFILLDKGVRRMEAFILSMVATIGLCFMYEMYLVEPVLSEVASGLVPSTMSTEQLYIAIGIIGATVMPHNLYLHSSLVKTREYQNDVSGIRRALRFNFFDSAIALNIAFLVNASILILAAGAFYKNGLHNVTEIEDAYLLLQNILGDLAPTLFAIALIVSGQSSTITGTIAGQVVMEGHLNIKLNPFLRRLITRLFAIIPAIITILFFGESFVNELLILSQVVLSFQLGFAVIPLIYFNSISSNHYRSVSKWITMAACFISIVIIYLNVKLVAETIFDYVASVSDMNIWVKILLFSLPVILVVLLIFVVAYPFIRKYKSYSVDTGEIC